MSLSDDYRFMAQALRLARYGMYSTRPNPRVGCVLVNGGEIVGRGYHHHAGGPHAEVGALTQAGRSARGACAYVTLEPCCHRGRTPPCTDALIMAGVTRAVYATRDRHPLVDGAGGQRLAQAGIETVAGVLEAEAQALNAGFFKRIVDGRPFVRVKMAMSLDGKTALAGGQSQWITGPPARADVQRLRAMSCVVLTGIGTVLADDPSLTVRDPRFDIAAGQPRRVVLDSALRTPPDHRIVKSDGEVRIFTCSKDEQRAAALRRSGANLEFVGGADGHLDLHAVLRRLAELEVNEVLVEAGPTVAGSFLGAGLADELIIYIAPILMGADARSAFAFGPVSALAEVPGFAIRDITAVGSDWRVTAIPA